MKTILQSFKMPAAIFLLIAAVSCSKKNMPIPVKAADTAPMVVYDVKNTAALYPTTGMVVDARGNLYTTEATGTYIQMFTPTGVRTFIAGTGHTGSGNGKGALASFNLRQALAIDIAGNIYVADSGNNLIRKIDTQGIVTTVAGSGAIGSANGQGTAASFNFPQGIAVDNSGNIYVADTGNDLLRKIDPAGVVTTLAGSVATGKSNGTGTAALFNIPQGLAVDNDSNIFVADAGNNLIRKITPSGIVSTYAGSGSALSVDGIGIKASFNFPNALSIDHLGVLYVTDGHGNKIRQITQDTQVHALGFKNLAFGGKINFNGAPVFYLPIYPNGVATDSQAKNIYVSDYGNSWLEMY